MFEEIIAKISVFHLNVLFLLGLALFGGTIGGRLFQKLKIPQVVGYIAIGIALGQSGINIVNHEMIETLLPFNYFALGLIGFMIGGELKREIFAKYGKQFLYILLSEGITAFIVVAALIGSVGSLFFDAKIAWSLGLLLGAIASATAPAATTEVLREYKTRGPLTTTVFGIIALDDGLALVLFAIAASIAGNLSGLVESSALKTFIHPLYEIGVAIIVGICSGFILNKMLRKYPEASRILAFTIGAVLLVVGLSLVIHVDMLIAAMTLGLVVGNFIPRKSKEVFELVGSFTPPIYVLFFVLVGAKLDISHMTLPIIILLGIYLLGRSAGKFIGSNFGAHLAKAPATVRKYLPLCLFSQAGVAIGLSILASHYFSGELGNSIVIIITASTFVLEIIGPPLVKVAVVKAGEAGLNITEEDLIQTSNAKDIMEANFPFIVKNVSLGEIIKIFSESNNLYYPVVDSEKKLLGIITVDNIKNTFMETSLNHFLLADDLMEPVVKTASPETTVAEIIKLLKIYHLECIPVVLDDNRLIGLIERRRLDRVISTKMMELQRQADFLEGE